MHALVAPVLAAQVAPVSNISLLVPSLLGAFGVQVTRHLEEVHHPQMCILKAEQLASTCR